MDLLLVSKDKKNEFSSSQEISFQNNDKEMLGKVNNSKYIVHNKKSIKTIQIESKLIEICNS